MQILTNKAADQIKGNQKAIGRLMTLFNKSSFTIGRWIEDKDVRLGLPASFQIIKEESGLSDKEILEDSKTYHRA